MERNHHITEQDDTNQATAHATISADKFLSETTPKCGNLNISIIDTGIDNKSAEKDSDRTGNGTHVAGVGDVSKPNCTIFSKSAEGSKLFDNATELLIDRSVIEQELTHGRIFAEKAYGKGVPQRDLFSSDVTQLIDLFSGKFDRMEK